MGDTIHNYIQLYSLHFALQARCQVMLAKYRLLLFTSWTMCFLAASRNSNWSKPSITAAHVGSRTQADAGRGLKLGSEGWRRWEKRWRRFCSMASARGAEEATSLGSALLFSNLLISSTMAGCRLEGWF
jgi:hypothetical protein